ncbi:MAG: type II toxin-antitoxin system PemK/MazF family toxin [Deltaproteobacteria bacterium]|nr:type II toxin-antitoxin system PemK/MazF family toxin [Deltaproteobacteria bacterium]
MTFEPFDVVTVPFPFTDSSRRKKRPALVLSSAKLAQTGHSILAMITSAKNKPWVLDSPIKNRESAGLTAESVVRMKLFTLDHRFILAKIGRLMEQDKKAVLHSLKESLEL